MEIEEKKKFLDKLFYQVGKQQYDFELCCLGENNAKSKWRKYLDVQSDNNFLVKVNSRTILPNEVVLDIEEKDRLESVLNEVKKIFKFYSAYFTGGRGFHVDLFFNQELTKEEKLMIIRKFGADENMANERHMIGLENCPHRKTGKLKTLIEENFGYNEFNPEDLEPELMQVLRDPDLFKRITEIEFDKKIKGELKSRKAIFLSLCSIWVKDSEVPLNILVSSESSAGKSFVCKKIKDIFPQDLVEYRSKISAEAFTYWHVNDPEWTWDGKICYLEDISQTVLDSATFKVMCSEGSVATVVRNQRAVDLYVNGTPCMLVTTASTNPNTEVINRFQIAQLDESVEQTIEITKSQALQEEKKEYDPDVKRALTFLKRKNVLIPYAVLIHEFLKNNYSFEDLRMRRDFVRLLDLIRCSCVLHQYQRQTNEKRQLIATEQDYEIAREIINYITGTTLKGLTHKLKKAYEACLEEGEFSALEIHSHHPFVSLTQWYKYLDELLERNLLTKELKEQGGYERDGKIIGAKRVSYYKVVGRRVLNLPKFNQLNQLMKDIERLEDEESKPEDFSLISKNGLNGDTKQTNLTNLIENSKIKCKVLKKIPELVNLKGEVLPSFEEGEIIELDFELVDPLRDSGYLESLGNDNPQKQPNYT